jgi:hypothetical protein
MLIKATIVFPEPTSPEVSSFVHHVRISPFVIERQMMLKKLMIAHVANGYPLFCVSESCS